MTTTQRAEINKALGDALVHAAKDAAHTSNLVSENRYDINRDRAEQASRTLLNLARAYKGLQP